MRRNGVCITGVLMRHFGLAVMLALAGAVLAGCNTVEGLGRDVQSGGSAISGGASKVQQKLP